MLKLTVFNVGQASSTLLQFGDYHFGVVDCGAAPTSGRNPVAIALRDQFRVHPQSEIAFLLLTHLDFDHISGLAEILDESLIRERVRRLLCNATDFRTLCQVMKNASKRASGITRNPVARRNILALTALVRFINETNSGALDIHSELIATDVNGLGYPTPMPIPELPDYEFHLFAPSQALRDINLRSIETLLGAPEEMRILRDHKNLEMEWNASSAVLAVEYRGCRLLLTGDANKLTWHDILRRNPGDALRSNVVVAWHHGARLGAKGEQSFNDDVWSCLVRPNGTDVLVSHGCQNPYGHPHDETIESVLRANGRIHCTQLRLRANVLPPPAAFRTVGLALEVGGGQVQYYKDSQDVCCGDITVLVDSVGEIDREFAANSLPGVHTVGCCRHLHSEVAM